MDKLYTKLTLFICSSNKRKINRNKVLRPVSTEASLFPDAYHIYDTYGECLFKLNDYENAIIAYKKALELNLNSKNPQRMLTYLLTKC